MDEEPLGSSFRDPSGHVFLRDGILLRRLRPGYLPHYRRLMDSGLYAALLEKGWLIPHEELAEPDSSAGLLLQPEALDFVSHPYEWCFGQLRDAALLTLQIQKRALDFDMTLKDASAYNVQFHGGRPVCIDTLSFECAQADRPWVAYRQFCQHFLAPLALMSLRDVRLGELLRLHLDGIPLDLTASLLPRRAWLRPALLAHVRVHAAFQRRYATVQSDQVPRPRSMSRRSLLGLIDSLESTVRRLRWDPEGTEWAGYYEGDSYGAAAFEHKQKLVAQHLDTIPPGPVWDLGANTGVFSRLAAERDHFTVAFDVDPACVERSYRRVRENAETRLLPLLMDLTNPSPALGFEHRERASWIERGPAQAVIALALIHHLAIGNNVPLPRLARFLARIAEHAIVEFVPKDDPKVQVLLAAREDVFPDYTEEGFRAALADCFEIVQATPIRESRRSLYLLRRREMRPV